MCAGPDLNVATTLTELFSFYLPRQYRQSPAAPTVIDDNLMTVIKYVDSWMLFRNQLSGIFNEPQFKCIRKLYAACALALISYAYYQHTLWQNGTFQIDHKLQIFKLKRQNIMPANN